MKKLVTLLFILSTHAYSTSPCAHEWNRVKSWSQAERNTSTFLIPPVILYSTALPILFPVSLGVTAAAAIAKGKYEFEKKKRKETFEDYEKCMMNHAKIIQNRFKNINTRLSEQQERLNEINEKFATASVFPISDTHPRPRQDTAIFSAHSTKHVPYSQTNQHRTIDSISEAHPWVDFHNRYIDNSYASIKNLQKQTLEEISTAKASLESFVRDLENIDQTHISRESELEKRVQKTKQNYERWIQLRDQKQKILQKATEERSHVQTRYRFVELSEKALLIARDFHFDQQWDLASTVMDYAQDALDFAIQPENQFQYDLITGMTPGISWGRDVFEAIFGIDLITGAELSSVERSMAILGVVTAGTGNKVGRIAKIINKADDYMDRSENIENATDAVRHTERVLDSAKKHGISDNRIAPLIGDMKNWGRTKGNFDISDGTSKEAKFLGESWVGPDARQIDYGGKPGKFQYISQDGTKKYREPVVKDGSGIKQANFEWKDPATGKWIGNGHMDITD